MSTRDTFINIVEQALEQLDRPAALGETSPLAAPYFLGRFLEMGMNAGAGTAEARGNALIGLLRRAAEALTNDERAVLNVAFFEASKHPALNELRASALHRSLRTYYRDRTAAIRSLAAALSRLVIPPIRPELPRTKTMVGRDDHVSSMLRVLQAGKSLAVTGPGGSGKTTLGAHIVAEWAGTMHFWFTIRPGFTDSASALLFGLCHQLRDLGTASAWQQLIADSAKEHTASALGRIRPLLRHDLDFVQHSDTGQPRRFLVCIDDIDLLDPQRAEHDRTLDVIRELRDLVPVLLIGQNLILDADEHVQLSGLSEEDIAAMLRRDERLALSDAEIERLAVATRGLPALVRLFTLLHQLGEPVERTLRAVESGASADVLLQRAWVRLSEAEQRLLMQIAIYDGYAPADEWLARDSADMSPAAHNLLTFNAFDGVAVMAHLRPGVLRRVPSGMRPGLHIRAAETLAARAEYTSAARQYQQAGQSLKALEIWGEHSGAELERGQAETALAMLRDIASESLETDDERRVLFLMRAELHRRMGDISSGLDDLAATTWPAVHPLTPAAETLRGDLQEFSGGVESALASYEAALRALAGQREAREVNVYNKIGFIRLYRARNLDLAWQAAVGARFRSESLHGRVLEAKGDFTAAGERYRAAATLLDEMENATLQRAMNESDQGRIAMMFGDYESAIARLRASIQSYEQVGDQANAATEHMNLSYALNVAGRYDEGLTAATSRMQFAQDRGDAYLVSSLACTAADSCAFLGRLEEAEHYIALALLQEEEFHRHYILTVQAIVDGKRKHYAQAEQRFGEAIQLAQESEDPFGEAPAWRWLALTYWQQGKEAEATVAIERARTLYQSMGMAHEVANIERLLSEWGG